MFLPLKNGRRRPLSRRHTGMIDGVLKLAHADRFLKVFPTSREAAESFSDHRRLPIASLAHCGGIRRLDFRKKQFGSGEGNFGSIPLKKRVSFRVMRDPSLQDWPPLHKCSARTPGFQHGAKLRGAHRRTSTRSRAVSSDRAHPPVEPAALHMPVVQGTCRNRKPGPPRLAPWPPTQTAAFMRVGFRRDNAFSGRTGTAAKTRASEIEAAQKKCTGLCLPRNRARNSWTQPPLTAECAKSGLHIRDRKMHEFHRDLEESGLEAPAALC